MSRPMWLIAAAAALAGAAAPATAAEDAAARLPQLAPGEVLLEADGFAVVRTPASSATVITTVHAAGASEAEARRALEGEVARVRAAAREAGASDADVRFEQTESDAELRVFDVEDPSPADAAGADDPAPSEPVRHTYLQGRVTIRLRNAGAARALQQRISSGDLSDYLYGSPRYELADDSAPRREARRLAIADARADAEAYADALGMRIVRMLRVTERAGLGFGSMLATERGVADRVGPRFGYRPDRADDAAVETVAVVGVDYVLAPR